jgi:hypothetical protein
VSNSLDVTFDLPLDGELATMFNVADKFYQKQAASKIIAAGVAPVVARARNLAPRSTQEARSKRSRKQQSEADWNYPLWKTINYVIRDYKKHSAGVIGPEWPKGNKAYFNTSPKGRSRKLWGRDPNLLGDNPLSLIAPQIRNWIVQAFDETKTQQRDIVKAKLIEMMDEIFTKNG